jgi:hypothetical protein
MKRAVMLFLAVSLLSFTYFLVRSSRHNAAEPDDLGTTTGDIVVDTPEIYTRERLVNDRFKQESWLKHQLDATDQETFDPEISAVTLVASAARHRTTVKLQGPGGAGPQEAGKAVPAAEQETQQRAPEPDQGGLRSPTSSAIDRFRDKLAYRDVVRAAMMETQLDDRHDIKGNTLYRLKFDATILPQNDTSAWALVYVEMGQLPRDRDYASIYKDWLESYSQQLNEKAAAFIKGLSSRRLVGGEDQDVLRVSEDEQDIVSFANYLSRRLAERMPRSESEAKYAANLNDQVARGVEKVREESARLLKEYEKVVASAQERHQGEVAAVTARYALLRKRLAEQASAESEPGVAKKSQEKRVELSNLRQSQLEKLRLDEQRELTALGERQQVELQTLFQTRESSVARLAVLSSGNTSPTSTVGQATPDDYDRVAVLLSMLARDPSGQGEFSGGSEAFAHRMSLEHILDVLKERSGGVWSKIASARIDGCEEGLCRLRLLPAAGKIPPPRFIKLLRNDTQVFSYSVTPTELVQRISSLTTYQQAQQVLSGMTIKPEGADLSTLTELLDHSQAQLNAVLRRPLIVGLSSKHESANDVVKSAAFGWLIGPRFEVGGSGRVRFRHAATQNALSSIVSVPSWWRAARLTVSTCWIREKGVTDMSDPALFEKLRDMRSCAGQAQQQTHMVLLPGTVSEVARKLGLDVIRRPYVRPLPDLPRTLEAGNPAEILIRGGHLWRSTVVTLGAQTADEIVVMPNMEAIIARFCEIHSPSAAGPGGRETPVILRVWTSEGSAWGGPFNVVPARADSAGSRATRQWCPSSSSSEKM